MRATPFLSFSFWNNFFYDCQCLRQGCSGVERVGTAFLHLFHVLLWNELGAVLKWLFFDAFPHLFSQHYIPGLSVPLNKGDHTKTISAGSYSLYLQFKLTIWAQNYPRKHINCTTPIQERHYPRPLRHAEKQPLYWKWAKLSLQSSSLQPPKPNVDKPA